MKQKTARFVLDALPLIVLFSLQKGWEITKGCLDKVMADGDYCVMSSVNLGEVYYSLLRNRRKLFADRAIEYILNSQIEVIFPNLEVTMQAACFKSGGGLSYADCYAAARVLERGTPVLTGDPGFSIVEREGVLVE